MCWMRASRVTGLLVHIRRKEKISLELARVNCVFLDISHHDFRLSILMQFLLGFVSRHELNLDVAQQDATAFVNYETDVSCKFSS
jgi:hypothetical protein